MAEIVYDIKKTYAGLDSWIAGLTEGTYNVEVDCSGVGADQFDGSNASSAAPFGEKLKKAKPGVKFNLKPINIAPEITNCSSLFYGCTGLITVDCSAFTQVTNASRMFQFCPGLTTIDTSAFTQVNDAKSMFNGCTGLTTIDCSVFKKVTNASYMFLDCSGLTTIDTSAFTQVNNAYGMFGRCTGLTTIDCSAFTKVNDASFMFQDCTGLKEITWGNIKPATVTDMFSGASATKTIGVTDQETVDWIKTNKSTMSLTNYTAYINTYTKKYSELDAFIPTLTSGTYYLTVDCTGENDLSQFGTFLQKAKEGVFFNLIPTNVQAKDLNNIFKGTSSLKKIDTTNFENIENSNNMFENCIDLNNIIWGNNFTPNSITNMFTGCGTINVYANGWLSNEFVKTYANDMSLKYKFTNGSYEKPSAPKNIDYSNINNAFLLYFDSNTYDLNINCASADSNQFIGSELSASPLANKLKKDGVYFNLTLSDIKPEVTDCSYMFFNFLGLEKISFAKSVQQRSLSNGISNANHMFDKCLNLKEIDTTPFAQVTTADNMFTDCANLTSINTTPFAQVTTADNMFTDCANLTSINTTPFAQVTTASGMFEGCSSLAVVTDNNGNVFTKGADCSTLPVKKVYINRSVKEQIKNKFPSSAKFLAKIIQRTYKVTDLKDSELSLDKDNRYINGNLIIEGDLTSTSLNVGGGLIETTGAITGGTINGATITDNSFNGATVINGAITGTSLKINKSLITTNDAGDFIFSWS